MMILNSSYRGPLTFNEEVIEQAERGLDRLHSALRQALESDVEPATEVLEKLQQQMESTRQGFLEAMDDDFNTAGALGQIYDLVRVINQARDAGADEKSLNQAQGSLKELTGLLGLKLIRPVVSDIPADEFVDLLVEIRRELREQKLWALSDMIRERLETLGVLLEDSKGTTSWRWK
jgi:cysteinyl-tRNA synthetase